ncbi:hypothetical protein Golob_006169 [Gossypium lobatum]|uniref:Zinc knuckle CX2CX4HX4C domain-containing protein n=1 Tax=Gossypium lobatum TaxID=34289 RepID=A0A7J8MVL6_9ROSI|nr:hypothetical protein [Gossypium lobatum]
MEERLESDMPLSTDELNELLERLKFSKEESVQGVQVDVVYKRRGGFVALKEGVMIVKFGCLEDQSRILNLTPWLFNICLFLMLSFEKGKGIKSYEFWLSPFWLRVYNFPIELMACQTAIDVGNALGELITIDWKERFGGWTEFIRLKVKINMSKLLRRAVKLVDKDRVETIGVIKYERLSDFCYACGLIGHSIKTCKNKMEVVGLTEQNLQYESWLRALTINLNQERGLRRNRLELIKQKTQMNDDKEESQTNLRDENGQPEYKGKEKRRRRVIVHLSYR